MGNIVTGAITREVERRTPTKLKDDEPSDKEEVLNKEVLIEKLISFDITRDQSNIINFNIGRDRSKLLYNIAAQLKLMKRQSDFIEMVLETRDPISASKKRTVKTRAVLTKILQDLEAK